MRRGLITATVLAVALVTTACVTGPLTPPTKTRVAVHDRQNEIRESREVRFLGRSKDGETGYKEHLVRWKGPGSTPEKVVVPFPLVVYDVQYRWRVSNIFGGFYRTPRGGYCWNFKYHTPRADSSAPRVNYAFACQHRDGRWHAFKNREESPAR